MSPLARVGLGSGALGAALPTLALALFRLNPLNLVLVVGCSAITVLALIFWLTSSDSIANRANLLMRGQQGDARSESDAPPELDD
jgi:hypothetical protein